MKASAILLTLALAALAYGDGDGESVAKSKPKFKLASFKKTLVELAESNGDQELVPGVTANKLLAFEHVNPDKCSQDDLFEFWFTCEMLVPAAEARLYCIHRLHKTAPFCARQRLGQNPGQFAPLQRNLVQWSRLLGMKKEERLFWTRLMEFKGDPEAMVRHLAKSLVPQSDKDDKNLRYDYKVQPKEMLSREQLLAMLKRVRRMDIHTTVAVLSLAKDKETTEVVNGVTVADLMQMNNFSMSFCETPDELIRRNKLCVTTAPLITVRFYCKSVVRSFASVCPSHLREDMDSRFWWLGVWDTLTAGDMGTFLLTDKESELEKYLLKDPAAEHERYKYIMSDAYVEDLRRKAQEKKDREAAEAAEATEAEDGPD